MEDKKKEFLIQNGVDVEKGIENTMDFETYNEILLEFCDSFPTEVNKFNPLLALDGGNDGLDCYKYLSKSLQKNIKNSTKIFLEIGKGQENDINDIFSANNYKLLNIYKDLSGVNRVLCFVPRETTK